MISDIKALRHFPGEQKMPTRDMQKGRKDSAPQGHRWGCVTRSIKLRCWEGMCAGQSRRPSPVGWLWGRRVQLSTKRHSCLMEIFHSRMDTSARNEFLPSPTPHWRRERGNPALRRLCRAGWVGRGESRLGQRTAQRVVVLRPGCLSELGLPTIPPRGCFWGAAWEGTSSVLAAPVSWAVTPAFPVDIRQV